MVLSVNVHHVLIFIYANSHTGSAGHHVVVVWNKQAQQIKTKKGDQLTLHQSFDLLICMHL